MTFYARRRQSPERLDAISRGERPEVNRQDAKVEGERRNGKVRKRRGLVADCADDTECRPDAEEGSRPAGQRKSADSADYTDLGPLSAIR